MIFIIQWVSISLTERNNCSFPAGLNEFFLNSGSKGLRVMNRQFLIYTSKFINNNKNLKNNSNGFCIIPLAVDDVMHDI